MPRGLCRGALLLVLLATGLLGVQAGRDYYDVLSVPRGAGDAQIKRSYRKLALQYHPDKVEGTEEQKQAAARKFAEIGTAYEALSDPEKRKVYDRHGEEGLRQHDAQGGGGASPQDIFSHLFGGRGGPFGGFGGFGFGGEEEEEQTPRGDDVRVDLEVDLRQLYLGHTFSVVRDKSVIKLAKGKRQCRCRNKMVTRQLGPGMYQQYTTQECDECTNVQFVRESAKVDVVVEPGMRDGQEIAFFEEGEPMVDGDPGDLKFVIRTAPHPHFRREGDDLHYGMAIKLLEALAGYDLVLEHLDGHKVPLQSSSVTKPGEVRVIKGEGMPVHEGGKRRGDLYVTHSVLFPQHLTEPQRKAARDLLSDVTWHDEL